MVLTKIQKMKRLRRDLGESIETPPEPQTTEPVVETTTEQTQSETELKLDSDKVSVTEQVNAVEDHPRKKKPIWVPAEQAAVIYMLSDILDVLERIEKTVKRR